MKWFYKAGELARENWDVWVDGKTDGWKHTGTRVGDLSKHQQFDIPADDYERMIFPLNGEGINVKFSGVESGAHFLRGREDVFHGPADNLYLPVGCALQVTGEGKFLIAEAVAQNAYPARLIKKEDVPILIRGAGSECRQVHNFGVPEHLDADRMIVVEVVVPAGNWSGIPPHKHDTHIPGEESNLEEIYYFESAPHRNFPKPAQFDATGYFRGYQSDDREYDELEEVRSGDVALVPWGYHGPAMATPAYDFYFMNVMAGPDPDRSWNIKDDPNHAWVRQTWEFREADPRLPFD